MTFFQILALIVILLLIISDIQFMFRCWHIWIKLGMLIDFFPGWKNTKKIYVWFVLWTSSLWLNLIPAIMMYFVSEEIIKYAVCFCCIAFYCILLGIIYVIVKHNIRYYYDRKKEKAMKKAEAEDQNRKEQSAETQPDKPAQNDSTDETDK